MISASVLGEAFPNVEPGVTPLGGRVLVQLRTTRQKTSSGLILAQETREFNNQSCQLAKVISLGPIAYKGRGNGQPWPEGTWANPGDFVRVPKYGGDKFERSIPGTDDKACFAVYMDHEIISQVNPEAFEELDEIK